jgi:hypothetical protein
MPQPLSEVRPFRALHYDPDKIDNISDLHLSILEHFHVRSYSFNGGNDGEVPKRWLRNLRNSEPGVHNFGALITKWKLLDVNILNTLILRRIVGLTEEQLSAQTNVAYTKDLEAALDSVRNGTMQVALILNGTRLQDIITIAENNERMPRKSTHFYPKPLSGLVLFPMSYSSRDSEA